MLRTVAFGKPLPQKTLDEETTAELKNLRITEPVPPNTAKTQKRTTVELAEENKKSYLLWQYCNLPVIIDPMHFMYRIFCLRNL